MQLRCKITRRVEDQELIAEYNDKEATLEELFLQFLNKEIVISVYEFEVPSGMIKS